MTMDPASKDYIYLDGETEREQLISEIHKARLAVRRLIDTVPEEHWYEPRYHGWSLAAMLGHLNLTDNIALFLIRAALVGFRFRMGPGTVERVNNISASMFRRRLISVSIKSMKRNEDTIAAFIRDLPINQFTREVFNQESQQFTTVERYLQDRFLFHWRAHLKTMRDVEEIQASERSDNL